MLRVAIIDKRDVISQGLSKILENHPRISPIAVSGPDNESILKSALEYNPEVVVVDIGYNGIELFYQAHRKLTGTRFITVTDHPAYNECCMVIENGAGAYLSKEDIKVDNIGETILLVADGKYIISPLIINQMFSSAGAVLDNLFSKRLTQKALSERESSILTLVARGLSNNEIAANLGISVHTVRVHVRNIMEKLGANNRIHAVYLSVMNELTLTRASAT